MAAPGRHDRQARLDGIGAEGQERIGKGHVLIVGLGGLGCPAALYLAGAGIGHLTLVDGDEVDTSNLHRQTLYTQADVGKPKASVAQRRLLAIDPSLDIDARFDRVTADNAAAFVAGHHVVLDCTDDLDAKVALARACAHAGIPLVHGAAAAWEGIVAVFDPPRTACYFCAFPNPQAGASCADVGVLGPLVGQLGALQAQEAIKLVAGLASSLAGRLHLVDAQAGEARTITLKRRPGCECTMPKTANPTPRQPLACPAPWAAPPVPDIAVPEFAARRAEFFVLDVREAEELEDVVLDGQVLNIPLNDLPDRMHELPQGRPIVCVCAVGGRSGRATTILREHGFDAINLRGGMRSWLLHHQ